MAKGLDVEEVVLASAGAVWLGLHRDASRSGEPLAFLRGRCVRACVELSALIFCQFRGSWRQLKGNQMSSKTTQFKKPLEAVP